MFRTNIYSVFTADCFWFGADQRMLAVGGLLLLVPPLRLARRHPRFW